MTAAMTFFAVLIASMFLLTMVAALAASQREQAKAAQKARARSTR